MEVGGSNKSISYPRMSETLITKATEFIEKNKNFHTGGFYDDDRRDGWDFKRIELMKEYIEKNWIPVGKTSRHIYGSYGLKHELERSKWTDASNTYVANGELILAMYCAGYELNFKKVSPTSPNCNFRVNPKPTQKQLQKVLLLQQPQA